MENTKQRRIVRTEQKQTVIADTEGVVNEEKNEFSISSHSFEVEPDFVKLYLKDIARLYDLPKATSKLMLEILKFMGYDNIVALGKYRREEIAKSLGISPGTLANALTRFIDEGLIMKVSSSEYFVNPNIFGKGKWRDIKKLRIMMEYGENGKTFSMIRE